MAMRQLTIDVEDDLRNRLIRWAQEEGRSLSNLLRRIATVAVEQHDRRRVKARDAA